MKGNGFIHVLSGDLKRAILSGRLFLGVVLGVLMLYQPAYPFSFFGGVRFSGSTLLDAMQDTLGLGAYVLCAAIICVLPYGDAHAWEQDSGAFPYLLIRAGMKNYVLSKVIAAAISGGLVLSLPFLIFCSVQALAFAPGPVPQVEWATAWFEIGALFCYGACWALCSLSFSAFLPSPLVVLSLPFCLTRFLWLLSAFTDLSILDVTGAIDGLGKTVPFTWAQVMGQQAFLWMVFVLLFVVGVKRKKCS